MHENSISPHHQSSNCLHANPALPLVRNLDEGDYRPDWRAQAVENYLTEVAQAEDKSTKALELAQADADEFVRRLLHFHCGLPCESKPAVEYAIACVRRPESALAIKAMVVAGRSVEQIAEEMGTAPHNIECFEQLYFDARRYLGCRLWLGSICRGERGHRWLEVALDRGWAGVEEIVLRRLPHGRRDLRHVISVLAGRVQDYIFSQEASNVVPSEKDLALLRGISPMHDKLPFLEDPLEEEQPAPESAALNSFKKLSFGRREVVRSFIEKVIDGAARKAAETEQANAATEQANAETQQANEATLQASEEIAETVQLEQK
jgi:hypothetical protein